MTIPPNRIPTDGREWLTRTAIWSRAIAVVGLLMTTVILILSDWDPTNPPQSYLIILFGGPSIFYFVLSFLIRRWHGRISIAQMNLAAAQTIALLVSTVVLADAGRTDFNSYGFDLYLLIAIAVAAGLASLIVSAYWARRMAPRAAHDIPRSRLRSHSAASPFKPPTQSPPGCPAPRAFARLMPWRFA